MHTKLPVEASGGHETPLQQRVETRPQLVRAIGRWSLTAGIINAVIGGGIFAYGGFESGIVAASETRNPKGDTVFALISAMTIVTLVYGFIQLTVVGVLPNAAGTTTPIAFALRVILGNAGFAIGSLAVIVSVYGWLTGFALLTPRILFCDRRDYILCLASRHSDVRSSVDTPRDHGCWHGDTSLRLQDDSRIVSRGRIRECHRDSIVAIL